MTRIFEIFLLNAAWKWHIWQIFFVHFCLYDKCVTLWQNQGEHFSVGWVGVEVPNTQNAGSTLFKNLSQNQTPTLLHQKVEGQIVYIYRFVTWECGSDILPCCWSNCKKFWLKPNKGSVGIGLFPHVAAALAYLWSLRLCIGKNNRTKNNSPCPLLQFSWARAAGPHE